MRSSLNYFCNLLVLSLLFVFIYLQLRFYQFYNEASAINIYNITFEEARNETSPYDICLFIWGTTSKEEHTLETYEMIKLYKKYPNVYFMMDDLSNLGTKYAVQQHQICNMSDRCFFVKYQRRFKLRILAWKTLKSWQYIYDNKFYNKCKWLVKMDTDAYVDMHRLKDHLINNYNEKDNWYIGYVGGSTRPYPGKNGTTNRIMLAWGGAYIISTGLLSYIKWDFTEMRCPCTMTMEDFQFAVIVKNHTNTTVTPLNGCFVMVDMESKMQRRWNRSKNSITKGNECYMVWHKVTPQFRLEIINDMKSVAFDPDHCSQWTQNALSKNYIHLKQKRKRNL